MFVRNIRGPKPKRRSRLRVGALATYIDSFVSLLCQRGYTHVTRRAQMGVFADLGRWLERSHVGLKDLDERHVEAFFQARWQRVSNRRGKGTIKALLQHLRQSNVIPTAKPAPPNDIDFVEQEYRAFLTGERALTQGSVAQYLRIARRFVSHWFKGGSVRLHKLRAKNVTEFVLADMPQRSRSAAQCTTKVLRSFLGYLFQQGRTTTNLAVAVPTVPGWRLSQLPRFLEGRQVEKVLRCCDRRTKMGKRDYAILVLLARLGLRAGEVAKLALDDIDWQAGELLVRGKGTRIDKLPLLQDVGQALVEYLQKARPQSSSRSVFLRSRAPFVGFPGAGAISWIARSALARAQVYLHHRAAHVFRHSLATQMLGNGASLAQIGQVLRHQHVSSTEIYAKVDLNPLRRLALPWPGGVL